MKENILIDIILNINELQNSIKELVGKWELKNI
jgi:hypothetical protein